MQQLMINSLHTVNINLLKLLVKFSFHCKIYEFILLHEGHEESNTKLDR